MNTPDDSSAPLPDSASSHPPPAAFDTPRWPRPEEGAPQAVVLAAVAVSLFGGWAAFHGAGVGIGLALTGTAMTVLPLAASGREALAPRLPGVVLVAALWSVAAIRDAGWVVAVCSLAAFALAPLALAPQRRFSGAFAAAVAYLEGLADALRWTGRGSPRGRGGASARNLRVAAVTAGLLVVFGGLFAAADRNFADLIGRLVPDLSPVEAFLRLLLAAALLPVILLWAYTAVVRPRYDPATPPRPRSVSRFEIAVPLGALNALFAAFLASQAHILWGGKEYVVDTYGLTFAEYARSGFWQLSVVAVLALTVVAVAAWFAPRRARGDRWTVRALLGGLCVMSLAVVASAMFRMGAYFEAYGLTRLRLWVFTVEIWLAVLFVLVLACCWKLRASWLPRASLASGAVVLLALAAANPDRVIAEYNIDAFDDSGKLDVGYLQELSADAVPAFEALPEAQRACALFGRDDRDRPFFAWNLGAAIVADTRSPVGRDCRPAGVGEADTGATGLDPRGEGTSPGVPRASAFFDTATCDQLDMTAADEMFGRGAKGDYGVEPDWSATNAVTVGDGTVEASLACGYYGTGTGTLYVDVTLYRNPVEAAAALERDREKLVSDPLQYTVADLADRAGPGFTAVAGAPNIDLYHYRFVDDRAYFAASVADGPVDQRAEAVCADLGGQLLELYRAHA